MANNTTTEILVHFAAPSRSSLDDARYRAQVEAILGFDAVTRYRGEGSDDHRQTTSSSCFSSSSSSPKASTRPPQQDSLGSLVSVIPDSQQERPPQVSEKGPNSLSPVEVSSPSKRRRVDLPPPPPTPPAAATAAAAATARHDHNESHEQLLCQLLTSSRQSLLPLQIHPPPPPASTASFVTHITPTLDMLSARLKPSRSYRPLRQSRGLDRSERGYWFVRVGVGNRVDGLVGEKDRGSASPAPAVVVQGISSSTGMSPSLDGFGGSWWILLAGKVGLAGGFGAYLIMIAFVTMICLEKGIHHHPSEKYLKKRLSSLFRSRSKSIHGAKSPCIPTFSCSWLVNARFEEWELNGGILARRSSLRCFDCYCLCIAPIYALTLGEHSTR